jgi:hypothetical protein
MSRDTQVTERECPPNCGCYGGCQIAVDEAMGGKRTEQSLSLPKVCGHMGGCVREPGHDGPHWGYGNTEALNAPEDTLKKSAHDDGAVRSADPHEGESREGDRPGATEPGHLHTEEVLPPRYCNCRLKGGLHEPDRGCLAWDLATDSIVAWLRECEENAIHKLTRNAFHNAADMIEDGSYRV